MPSPWSWSPACSGRSTTGGSDAGGGQVTLKINFWGDFGLQDLKARYEAEHPNVKIQLNSGEYNAQHEDLQKKLVAGNGAPDIAAIDEGFIVQFRSQSDKFVNLLDKGAGSYESKYLPWKWKQSLSADGKTQIGLGTDVGGLAMCYRTDLFKAAGLPTERDQVSALWPTWDRFIEVGQQYTATTKKKFIDAGTNLFNPILGQQPVGFYDEQEQLRMEQGPKVAFDVHGQGRRRRALGQPGQLPGRLGQGLHQRRVRRAGLPGLDARPHQGHRARHRRASGTSPRSPVAAATGAARS